MKRKKLLSLLAVALLFGGALLASPALGSATPQSDRITLDELKALLASGKPVLILDVRHETDRKIKGSLHIPVDQVGSRLGEIPSDREIVTYCA